MYMYPESEYHLKVQFQCSNMIISNENSFKSHFDNYVHEQNSINTIYISHK